MNQWQPAPWLTFTLDVLTAIGTVGAVIIALWLARIQNRLTVRVKEIIVDAKIVENMELRLLITNTSNRDVRFDSVFFEAGFFWRKRYHAPWITQGLAGIAPADSLLIDFRLSAIASTTSEMIAEHGRGLEVRLFPPRATVVLSTGETATARLSAKAREMLGRQKPAIPRS